MEGRGGQSVISPRKSTLTCSPKTYPIPVYFPFSFSMYIVPCVYSTASYWCVSLFLVVSILCTFLFLPLFFPSPLLPSFLHPLPRSPYEHVARESQLFTFQLPSLLPCSFSEPTSLCPPGILRPTLVSPDIPFLVPVSQDR